MFEAVILCFNTTSFYERDKTMCGNTQLFANLVKCEYFDLIGVYVCITKI